LTDLNKKISQWSYHRQCLGKQGRTLQKVLKDVIGVYSSHPTAPLSLFARSRQFSENEFYQLEKSRFAVRIPAMRQSAYFLPTEFASSVMAAVLPAPDDPYWKKRYSKKGRIIPVDKYPEWRRQILAIARDPRLASEIKQHTSIPNASLKPMLNRLAFEGSLLRIGSENLRSNLINYVSTQSWLGKSFDFLQPDKALVWLAEKYLKAFGPARIKDFQWWTGVTLTRAKKAVSQLRTVPLEGDYLLFAEDLEKFENDNFSPTDTVDLLPQWDCYTMGYAPDGRNRFVSPDLQEQIYAKLGATGGNALGVVMVNGTAQGTWTSRFTGTQMKIALKMFEKPTAIFNKIIRQKFEEIATLLKAEKITFE
jgi:hypothetical protein